jgi:hypothetical protein
MKQVPVVSGIFFISFVQSQKFGNQVCLKVFRSKKSEKTNKKG